MYIRQEEAAMKTAKIFRSGNSQAVRIPKEFQLAGKEVEIERQGDALLLRSRQKSWDTLTKSLTKFTQDYMKGGRLQPRLKKRDRVL
jgi:antitoxin VapB